MERPSADEPTVRLEMKISDSLNQALANRLKQLSVSNTDGSAGLCISRFGSLFLKVLFLFLCSFCLIKAVFVCALAVEKFMHVDIGSK